MRNIGISTLRSFCPMSGKIVNSKCTAVRRGAAIRVNGYLELARKVAELQYENREYVLLYRGQGSDYRNAKLNTSIKPSIFRGSKGNPTSEQLTERFRRLREAESFLVSVYQERGLPRAKEMMRRQVLRWSILQHYEVCETPLLDVTRSLRVATSFAADHAGTDGYLMVLGVPSVAGAITTSMEAELQVIRLASVCPPQAVRPHIQEGYLLGEYPEISAIEQKMLYREYEVDFGRRLIAKFVFDKQELIGEREFPTISHNALYPESGDKLKEVTDNARELLRGC